MGRLRGQHLQPLRVQFPRLHGPDRRQRPRWRLGLRHGGRCRALSPMDGRREPLCAHGGGLRGFRFHLDTGSRCPPIHGGRHGPRGSPRSERPRTGGRRLPLSADGTLVDRTGWGHPLRRVCGRREGLFGPGRPRLRSRRPLGRCTRMVRGVQVTGCLHNGADLALLPEHARNPRGAHGDGHLPRRLSLVAQRGRSREL